MAMAELIKDLAFPSTTPGRLATVHGFRSTFKDWVSETTNYPNHVSEAALSHVVADKVEAAYRSGKRFGFTADGNRQTQPVFPMNFQILRAYLKHHSSSLSLSSSLRG
jgi:hypothetical protein